MVSIDIPTGVYPDTGEMASPAVDAEYTVTLAMPKQGMAPANSGAVWAADIAVPPEAYERLGFTGDIFGKALLVRYR